MSRARTPNGPAAPAPTPGPVVAVCTGHRCAGLRRLGGAEDLGEGLRSAVRASRGGVLMTCPCLGRCERGPVTVVGHHDGTGHDPGGQGSPDGRDDPTPMVWLTESNAPGWRQALETWVARGADVRVEPRGDGARSVVRLPGALREAVIGYSAGTALQRLEDPSDHRPGS